MKTQTLKTASLLLAALSIAAAGAPAPGTGILGASALGTPALGAALAAHVLDNPRFLDLDRLPDLDSAAGKNLVRYRTLVGQSSADAAAPFTGKAALGRPKRDFIIRLDALKAYRPGQDVDALLSDTRQVHYPILSDGKPKGSLTLAREDGGWSLLSVGEEQRTAMRQSAISASVKRFSKPEVDHFIVRVPALNLEFTAFRDGRGDLQLSSVTESPEAGLTAGEAESATQVLPRLAKMAESHDEMPR